MKRALLFKYAPRQPSPPTAPSLEKSRPNGGSHSYGNSVANFVTGAFIISSR